MPFRNIFICLALILARISAPAQSKEDKIKAIRQVFQKINQDHGLTLVKLYGEEVMNETPDNGVELTGWFKGDTLCKMLFSIGLSFAMEDFEYYFSHDRVIFIYETQRCYYKDSTGMDQSRVTLNFEGRYYLDKGFLIDMKLKGEKRLSDDVTPAYIRELVADADTYSKLLYKHHKK